MHGNGDEEWKRSRAETEMLLVREGESRGRSLEIRRLTTFFEIEEISVKRLCRVSREPGVSARHIRVDALAATTIPQRQSTSSTRILPLSSLPILCALVLLPRRLLLLPRLFLRKLYSLLFALRDKGPTTTKMPLNTRANLPSNRKPAAVLVSWSVQSVVIVVCTEAGKRKAGF